MIKTVEHSSPYSVSREKESKQKSESEGVPLSRELYEMIMNEPEICMVIVKPHAAVDPESVRLVEDYLGAFILFNNDLEVLIKMEKVKFTRKMVEGIYGDLCNRMNQIEGGKTFVEGLVNSFVNSVRPGKIFVLSGKGVCEKMRHAKEVIREAFGATGFFNIIHTSDDNDHARIEFKTVFGPTP